MYAFNLSNGVSANIIFGVELIARFLEEVFLPSEAVIFGQICIILALVGINVIFILCVRDEGCPASVEGGCEVVGVAILEELIAVLHDPIAGVGLGMILNRIAVVILHKTIDIVAVGSKSNDTANCIALAIDVAVHVVAVVN